MFFGGSNLNVYVLTGGFHSRMTLPRELGVSPDGVLTLKFVEELTALRTGPMMTTPATTVGRHLEIFATFEIVQPRGKPTAQGLQILSIPAAPTVNVTTVAWTGACIRVTLCMENTPTHPVLSVQLGLF